MKKCITFLLCLVIVFQLLPVGAALLTNGSSSDEVLLTLPGEGTSSNPFEISEEAHLFFMSEQINKGNSLYINAYYSLKNDITLSKQWIPVGNTSYPFGGTFNGNGNSINDLSVTSSYTYCGLFGITNGNIQNLNINNYSINNTSQYSGAVAGYNGGNIVNCHSSGKISVTNTNLEIGVGGIAGSNGGSVFFCSAINPDSTKYNLYANSKNTAGFARDPGAYVGGLVGINSGKINTSFADCFIYVQAANPNPGFGAGLVALNSGNITECYADGNVEIDSYYLAKGAGLVASNNGGKISNCFAVGNVKTLTGDSASSQVIGGLVAVSNGGGIKNSFRSKSQVVKLHVYAFWETGTVCKLGEEHENNVDFMSLEFLSRKLHWEASNWIKPSKGYPVLKSGDDAAATYTLDKVYGTGAIIFEYNTLNVLNDAESSFNPDTKILKINNNGHYNVMIENCSLVTFSRFALIPVSSGSNISAIHCDGNDALANEIFLSSDSEDEVELFVYPASGASIEKYQFIDAYNPLKANIIYESTDGKFSIVPKDLDDDNTYWIRAIGNDGTKYTPIQTNIRLVDDISADDLMGKLDIGFDIFTIDVPKGIPLIGGEEIKIGIDDLPVGIVADDDRILISIGIKDLVDGDFSGFKEAVKGLEEGIYNAKTKKFFHDKPKEDPFSFDYYGYIEIPINSRGYAHLNGIQAKLILTLSGEWEHQWQHYAFSVPIVVKVKIEASGTATLTVAFDENLNFDFNGSISVEAPKLTPSVGVGIVGGLDLSAYGSASHTLDIDFNTRRIISTLSGEVGVCATVLYYEFEEPWISGDIVIYDNGGKTTKRTLKSSYLKSLLNTDNYTVNRNSASAPSPISNLTADATVQILQSNTYNSSGVQVAEFSDGSRVMVWIADDLNKTDFNHTSVVWSKYLPEENRWTVPAFIDDDGTADFSPAIISNGEKIYVAWLDSNRVFDSAVDIETVASSCEISFAELSVDSDSFSTPVQLTADAYYDSSVKMGIVCGEVYIGWTKNTENDITLLSGENSLLWTCLSDLNTVETVSAVNMPIVDFTFGINNSSASVYYTVDPDSDYETDSFRLYCKQLSGTGDAILIDEGVISDLTSVMYNNEEGILAYNDGDIVFYGDSNEKTVLFNKTDARGFKTIHTQNGLAIVYVSSSDNEDDGSSAYIIFFDETKWTKPVLLFGSDDYIKDLFVIVNEDGSIDAYYSNVIFENADGNINRTSNICTTNVKLECDITLMELITDDANSDGKIPFEITVKNNGFVDIDGFDITLTDSAEKNVFNSHINTKIGVGDEVSCQIFVKLPKGTDGVESYTLTVTSDEYWDSNLVDNSKAVSLGYTNLSVSVRRLTSGKSVGAVVRVENKGLTAEEVVLNLRKDSVDGELLAKYIVGIVNPGEYAEYVLDAARFRQFCLDTSLYAIEAVSSGEELYYDDNYDLVVIEQNTITVGNKSVPAYCDVNGDNEINVLDLIMYNKMISNSVGKSDALLYDLNGDLVLNKADSEALARIIVGIN